ncbi:hypothetical protein L3X38_019174 [Prunus dulcis]|uniref:Uncharacterized protein n=1 Tax=Prunus dulcis TaxID=3755 RepID=A0AAD4WD01_PRUDU|nr:hypothetical protein L3X38_019174 [Prunus dulcis]
MKLECSVTITKNSQVPNPEVTSRPRTWGTTVYTIMNRADPASKRLTTRQPRLLPCRRKTHFRGAGHLPKLPSAKPNIHDTCRHHNGLHKVPHWNFVQSSHFHFPINREQNPGLTNPFHPRASALFPAEDLTPLITKLDSNSGRAILSINSTQASQPLGEEKEMGFRRWYG